MKDLAPGIYRQRLLIEGLFATRVDEAFLLRFFETLTTGLGLSAYTAPFVSDSTGFGQSDNQGYEAFLPLIESGIALYTWTEARFLSMIIYTCKSFDAKEAVRITRDEFALDPVEWREF